MTDCPDDYTEFDRACYQEPLTPQMLQSASAYLQSQAGPNDDIFVFPYQTMFGLASRRTVAGGLMQAYTASGAYLSQLEIAGLEKAHIPAALYLPDANLSHWSARDVARWSRNYLSVPVDGIPNFTRTPEVWFWTLKHYHSVQELSPGVVALARDDSRATSIQLQEQSLDLPQRTYEVQKRSSAIDLGSPNWPSGYDFIHLRLTVRYSAWWRLRKPERLELEISRADGTRDLQWMIAPPNVATDYGFIPGTRPSWRRISRPTPASGGSIRILPLPDCGCGWFRWIGYRNNQNRLPLNRQARFAL